MTLLNQMFLMAARQQSNVASVRLGLVSSVNPADSTIKVKLQPEDTETGWIPYPTPWIGWFSPPQNGDQAIVLFQEGSKDVPLGALLLYWNNSLPPQGIDSGEAILQHSSGSYIKLTNDGKININGDTEIDISAPQLTIATTADVDVTANGNINLTATTEITLQAPTINLDGNVTLSGDVSSGSGVSLESHVHSGVTSGPDNTGIPVS